MKNEENEISLSAVTGSAVNPIQISETVQKRKKY
jgi:hypothetical protein